MLLEELFRGNFTPSDFASPNTPEYKAANCKIQELTDRLKTILSPDDHQLLDDLISQIYLANCMELEQCFAVSFSAGIVLNQEAIREVEAII